MGALGTKRVICAVRLRGQDEWDHGDQESNR